MAIGIIGDFRSDAVNVIGSLPTMTRPKAEEIVTGLETFIKTRAKAGVMEAVPTLTAKAKKLLVPPFVAVGAVSLLALGASLVALRRTRRR